MKSLSKKSAPRTPASNAPNPDRKPWIFIAKGAIPDAVDEVASELHRLPDLFRCGGRLVRPHQGLKVTLEPVPFSAFHESLERAFEFHALDTTQVRHYDRGAIDCPTRLAKIIFESSKYWWQVREIKDASDLIEGGAQ